MTNYEYIVTFIQNYVQIHGPDTVLSKQDLYEILVQEHPIVPGSFMPSDLCYNRTNNGILYEKQPHLFELLPSEKYRILGTDYVYDGPVFWQGKEHQKCLFGYWSYGEFRQTELSPIDHSYLMRIKNLFEQIQLIHSITCVEKDDITVDVLYENRTIASILCLPEAYRLIIYDVSWDQQTTYYCTRTPSACYYFVDTMDECIGEIKRLCQKINTQDNVDSEITDTIQWDTGIENILQQFATILQSLFKNSPYVVKRNPTKGEHQVNVYSKGSEQRIAYIHPKVSTHSMDLCLQGYYFNAIKSLTDLPYDCDLKQGRSSTWRRLPKISFSEAIDIFRILMSIGPQS